MEAYQQKLEPGTGKTRTIVAIVSGLLALHRINDKTRGNCSTKSDTSSGTSSKMHISQSAAIARAWQDAAVARQLNVNEEINCKSTCITRGRVLICAQSSAAVDELVSRISMLLLLVLETTLTLCPGNSIVNA